MDPRNPKRPLDESGDNWARCAAHNCGRGASKASLIRHTKHCSGHSASPYADQGPLAERRAAEHRPPPTGLRALRARLATLKAAGEEAQPLGSLLSADGPVAFTGDFRAEPWLHVRSDGLRGWPLTIV